MRLTQSGLLNYKKQIIVDNRALLDGDCEYYEYTLNISTTITNNYGHQYFKEFAIMFNRSISYDLRSALCEWIEVCGVFSPIYNKVKFSIIVPEKNKDSQKVVDYLNKVFYTSATRVVGIRWAEFFKEDCLI